MANYSCLLCYKKKPFNSILNHLISYNRKYDTMNIEKSRDKNLIKKETSANTSNNFNSNVNNNSFNCEFSRDDRFNEINLQMLPNKLYHQIFNNKSNQTSYNIHDISLIKKELVDFGIIPESKSKMPNVDITIPPLHGENIEEHFRYIANEQVKPYLNIVNKLLVKLPPIPKHFILREGWTRYSYSGYEAVEYPQEDGLIYDVEVCMKNGPLPTLAVAVSSSSWYGWVSRYLVEGISTNFMNKILTPDVLVPLESTENENGSHLNKFQQMPKIVVGHNVSFDRIRVKEQYWLNATGTRFLDTMALHVSISGTSSYQRSLLKSKNLNIENDQLHSVSSLNNLADVYKLYCGIELDKKNRNIFVDGNLTQIRKKFQETMLYCALDVKATHEILRKVFPMFIERFPHPATLAGMLELGLTYLPVNYNWKRYLEEAEATFEDFSLESKICLSKRADQVCRLLISNKYKIDPWMWNEDWLIKDIKMKKGYEKIYAKEKNKLDSKYLMQDLSIKFKYLKKTKYFLPKKIPHMPGYPNWYRNLCSKLNDSTDLFPKVQKISTTKLITPKLLSLTWEGYPLHHIKEHGWGYIIPYKNSNSNIQLPIIKISSQLKLNGKLQIRNNTHEGLSNQSSRNFQLDPDINNCCYFFKLPHKNGIFFNVGNPLSKDFVNKFSENVLAGVDKRASKILEISKMCSYWKNNRDRIISQFVIWLDDKQVTKNSGINNSSTNFGAIIPQVVVSGTLTRRAIEPTWMTAANAQNDRIGSELRAMINAPANYNIVGADVDSQELWIASIIGDSLLNNIKIQGATPFSWMTLIGNKTNGTDMHSVTAKAINISRDQAKVLNYARIYGAGQKFAERLLKQFNPMMSDQEAMLKSKKMFCLTKGQKYYRLKKHFISENLIDKFYTSNEAFKISQIYGKSKKEIFQKGKWVGGSESAMFNSLEEIADQAHPVTPFLSARLSRALEQEFNEKNLPTKINWVVQSSAVDFLHLILVTMRWLMKDKTRLCLSFHDEVRYLVPSKYKYNAALAMHVTNLLVRSFFVSRLNMRDLPMSVAFFNAVEVDTVLRKEARQDCKTPSNPYGLQIGYGVNNGESLNVYTAIEKSQGCVGIISKI